MAIAYSKLLQFFLYLLIVSLFLPGFIYQYVALFALFIVFLFGDSKKKINYKYFALLLSVILLVALSYSFNIYFNSIDYRTIIYWSFSYFPPLFLLGILVCGSQKVDISRLYTFYKAIVFIQSVLLIYSSFTHGVFVVGDDAKGTVGNANFVAFHIAVVLLYEANSLLWNYSSYGSIQKIKKELELLYYFLVFMIPESTANIGFFFIIMALTFIRIVILKKNWKVIIVLGLIAPIAVSIFTDTYIYERIKTEYNKISLVNIEEDLVFTKIKVYISLLNGDIYTDVNPLVGSGPATFTSRSSVIRMPDIRYNSPPKIVPIDTYYSDVFIKFMLPLELELKDSPRGNLSTPKTTVISIAVELGMLGILILFFALAYVIYRFMTERTDAYLSSFGIDITLLFVMNLFFLNSWEYPIYSFVYILFAVTVYRTLRSLSIIVICDQRLLLREDSSYAT